MSSDFFPISILAVGRWKKNDCIFPFFVFWFFIIFLKIDCQLFFLSRTRQNLHKFLFHFFFTSIDRKHYFSLILVNRVAVMFITSKLKENYHQWGSFSNTVIGGTQLQSVLRQIGYFTIMVDLNQPQSRLYKYCELYDFVNGSIVHTWILSLYSPDSYG